MQDQLSSRVIEIEHLKLMPAKLRRMQFGRKSEKLDRQIEQLELRLEELQADEGAVSHRHQRSGRASRIDSCPAGVCRVTMEDVWRKVRGMYRPHSAVA